MPKGVEHNYPTLLREDGECVESLMPKGVEHPSNLNFADIKEIVLNL